VADREVSTSTTRRDLMAKAIIDCATALFDERGFSETSLQDIADEIGIQRPSLYHYFDSKDEILLTLLEDVVRQNETTGIEDAADLSPRARLELMLRNYGRSIAEDPARFRLITRNESRLPPDVLTRYRDRRRHNWELLKTLVAEGMADGTFRPLDVDLAASALHGAMTGMMFWFRPDRGVSVDDAVETVVDVLMRGLVSDTESDGVTAAFRTAREALDYLEGALAAEQQRR
jgi:AcrR family transcriptional regulator